MQHGGSPSAFSGATSGAHSPGYKCACSCSAHEQNLGDPCTQQQLVSTTQCQTENTTRPRNVFLRIVPAPWNPTNDKRVSYENRGSVFPNSRTGQTHRGRPPKDSNPSGRNPFGSEGRVHNPCLRATCRQRTQTCALKAVLELDPTSGRCDCPRPKGAF